MAHEDDTLRGGGDVRTEDLELARAAAGGEAGARRAVAERLFDRVRHTTRYLAAGHPDAEDHAQVALVEILRSLGTYSGHASLEHWADTITVRTTMRAIKRRRRLRAWQILRGRENLDREERLWAHGPRDAFSEVHLRQHVATLLGKLNPERRAAVVLRLVHGYSVGEIAELTGVGYDTVRDRLRVGRKALRALVHKDPLLRAWAEERGLIEEKDA